MSVWGWTLVGMWAVAMVAAVSTLVRTLAALKALKNLYLFKAFEVDSKEREEVPQGVWEVWRRIVHEVGCCRYKDLQFEMPPALHGLVMIGYFAILLLYTYIADLVSPASLFSPLSAIITSVCGSLTGLTLLIFTESLFIRTLNFRNHSSQAYSEAENRIVHTAPLDSEVAITRTNAALDDTEIHEKSGLNERHVADNNESHAEERGKVEAVLVTIVTTVGAAALWGIYEIDKVEGRSCLVHWAFGVVVDIPYRLLFAFLLATSRLLPHYAVLYQRIPYDLSPSDLPRFLIAPRSSPPPCAPSRPALLVYTEEDDDSRALFPTDNSFVTVGQRVPNHARNDPESVQTIEELLEESESPQKLPSSSAKNELSPCYTPPSSNLPSDSRTPPISRTPPAPISSRRSPLDESEIHTVISTARSSIPVTDRDPRFPVHLPLQRTEIDNEEVPILALSTPRTPEASDSLPDFDEFPLPSSQERFSDIEDSQAESTGAFNEPVIPEISDTAAKRTVLDNKPPSLTRTIKPGFFLSGQPIETLRQSRSPKRKIVKTRPQLDAIISESEEDLEEISRSKSLISFKSRKVRSPEPAESTRYQTPASPIIILADESVRVHPEPRVREVGMGIWKHRPLSPTATDEVQISFVSSESSTETVSNQVGDSRDRFSLPATNPAKRHQGKRRRKKEERRNKFLLQYDSPYQEILWRRIEADSGCPAVRKKESGQMRRYASLPPIVKDQRLTQVASQGGLPKRPSRPWY